MDVTMQVTGFPKQPQWGLASVPAVVYTWHVAMQTAFRGSTDMCEAVSQNNASYLSKFLWFAILSCTFVNSTVRYTSFPLSMRSTGSLTALFIHDCVAQPCKM